MNIDIIDPPVTPFSPSYEIKAWIAELEAVFNPSFDHIEALNFAREWLAFAERREHRKLKAIPPQKGLMAPSF